MAEGLVESLQRVAHLDQKKPFRNLPPAGYIRVKIANRSVLARCLIDSGNLFGNLISEKFAQTLRLKIVGSEKIVGTASEAGKLTILGKVSSPLRIYLENVSKVVSIQPYVVRELSHPLNLGQQFLREYSADMAFREQGIQLKICNSATYLTAGGVSLGRATIDHRIKQVLDAHQDRGRNPHCGQQESILDLRVNGVDAAPPEENVIPGIYHAQTKRMLSWNPTKTRVHNVEKITIPKDCTRVILCKGGKPGERRLTPVNPGPVMMFPNQNSNFLNKNWLFVHPGAYQRDKEVMSILISNVGPADVTLPLGCHLGHMTCAAKEEFPTVNELCHRDSTLLKASELEERRDFIRTSLKLKENEFLQDTLPHFEEEIIDVFMDNFDAVSVHEADYGQTQLLQFTIDMKPEARPVRMKLRPLNPFQEDDLRRQIDDWIGAKVVEPSNGPWASALVPVKKKGTDKLRWAVDFRKVNDLCVRDMFPLANIDTNLHKMANSNLFSTLDSCGAFHSVSIRPEDREKTGFVTPFGQYQFARLPFGLANAPACYSRLVQTALDRLNEHPQFALGYIDDIIIFSSTPEEHLYHLRQVLELHANVGMKINLGKCKIFAEEVEYLGHVVSRKGIGMIDSYVQRVLDWPLPLTGKDLSSFLGFTGYYRTFIKDYSRLTASMNKMKKDAVVQWDDETKDNFERLKQAFVKQPVRGYPQYHSEHPFILDSDWSSVAFACVLSQVQDGQERFLGCVAKKCNPAESLYPSHKGEMASVILGLKKFEHILRAKQFIIRTDSRCVEFMKGIKECRGIWARWLNFLSSFDFVTVHRAGSKQTNADALSRRAGLELQTEEEDLMDPYKDVEDIYSIDPPVRIQGITIQELQDATQKDPVLSVVAKYVRAKQKPDKHQQRILTEEGMHYINVFEALREEDGIVYFQGPTINGIMPPRRICIPEKYRELAYVLCHSSPGLGGHGGILATYQRMSRLGYFPHMYPYVSAKVNNCVPCIKKRPHLPKAQHQRYTDLLSYFGQKVFCDVVGPLTGKMYNGYQAKYFVTMQCGFSRFLVAEPVPDFQTGTVVKALIDRWVLHHGVMEVLYTDNGKNYTSNLWKEVMRQLGVIQVLAPPYSPEGNRVERAHQVLGNLLRADQRLEDQDWPEKLKYAVMVYNTSVNRITGVSPYEAVYGRNCVLAVDLVWPVKLPGVSTFSEHVEKLRGNLSTIYSKMLRNEGTALARRNANFQGRSPPPFKEGDLCYYFMSRVRRGISRKLQSRWIGPMIVRRVVSPSMVVIFPDGDWCAKPREIPAIVNRLKKIEGNTPPTLLRTPEYQQVDLDDVWEEPAEEAEIIQYQPEFRGEGGPAPPFVPLPEPELGDPPTESDGDEHPAENREIEDESSGTRPRINEGEQNPVSGPPEEHKFQPERVGIESNIEGGEGNSPSSSPARNEDQLVSDESGASPGRMRPFRKEASKARAKIYKVFHDPYGLREKKKKH